MDIIFAIQDLILSIKKHSSYPKFAIGIVTTAHDFDEPYFSFPRAIDNWGYYFHIVCPSSEVANEILLKISSEFSAFFIDAEIKNKKFSFKDLELQHNQLNFQYLYPNEITIQACLDLIDFHKDKSVFVLGHGNLAYKLVDALLTRSFDVNWYQSRVSSSKKYKRMNLAFSDLELSSPKTETSLLVNLSPQYTDHFNKPIFKAGLKMLDMAGRGSLSAELLKKYYIFSLDISTRLSNEVALRLDGRIYAQRNGSRTDSKGNTLVSVIYSAKEGDFIVDDYSNPSFLIGISDGRGGFKERLNKDFPDVI